MLAQGVRAAGPVAFTTIPSLLAMYYRTRGWHPKTLWLATWALMGSVDYCPMGITIH